MARIPALSKGRSVLALLVINLLFALLLFPMARGWVIGPRSGRRRCASPVAGPCARPDRQVPACDTTHPASRGLVGRHPVTSSVAPAVVPGVVAKVAVLHRDEDGDARHEQEDADQDECGVAAVTKTRPRALRLGQ